MENEMMQMEACKEQIAEIAAKLMGRGMGPGAIVGALGSVAGNMIGLTMKPEGWVMAVEMMKIPMLKDAAIARAEAIKISGQK